MKGLPLVITYNKDSSVHISAKVDLNSETEVQKYIHVYYIQFLVARRCKTGRHQKEDLAKEMIQIPAKHQT